VGDVRNCDDGTVEVRAEGPSDVIGRFLDRLGDGPPMARVDQVDELELVTEADLPAEQFEIVR